MAKIDVRVRGWGKRTDRAKSLKFFDKSLFLMHNLELCDCGRDNESSRINVRSRYKMQQLLDHNIVHNITINKDVT
eukprot:scaffold3015_cov21-Cyclotella_meneghiniana.AAC.1